jgi:uncharacterized protein involved in high-affinity Fe2+ transport
MVAGAIILGMVAILVFNFQPDKPTESVSNPTLAAVNPDPPQAGAVREYPIGDPVQRNHLQIAAVWLPGVSMEGMGSMSSGPSDLIHLEADVRSLGENPNGFAKDEFIPYLKVTYSIVPGAGGEPIEKGDFYPMIAADGLHYGANIAMPKPGTYRLIYHIEPPSAGGLGRHVGVGGVAPWWQPFTAEFEWIVEPVVGVTSLAGSR